MNTKAAQDVDESLCNTIVRSIFPDLKPFSVSSEGWALKEAQVSPCQDIHKC